MGLAVDAMKARASAGAFDAASRRSASGGGSAPNIGSASASRMSETSRSASPVDSSVTSKPNSCASASTTVVESGRLLFSIWLRYGSEMPSFAAKSFCVSPSRRRVSRSLDPA